MTSWAELGAGQVTAGDSGTLPALGVAVGLNQTLHCS